MKILIAILIGMLTVGLYLSLKFQSSAEWTYVKTEPHNGNTNKQFVRMAGGTLQIKHRVTNDEDEETVCMTNGISGPK
ncbi:hypothetical protein [Bacillus atrophaeus]|uniref:hypothetical protein n=1 Tax=Bacillus atrophaeus TaxID=1452 RepID=UPI00227E3EEF|nr:hypothetical protein [Bacillus atrophaeus]MCY8507011.1 hypothetical protein [Bacillus atrophaeus]MCY8948793.1 hypothetical protein [Bacillus atrophaeus]MCY8967210.1 hypothetical protein [Bacillus atrophaeus]